MAKLGRGATVNPLMTPVKYRLVPLHIVETTEKYMGTLKTRYLWKIKAMIFGPAVQ